MIIIQNYMIEWGMREKSTKSWRGIEEEMWLFGIIRVTAARGVMREESCQGKIALSIEGKCW